MSSVAVILGSAFDASGLSGTTLHAHSVDTPWGSVTLHRVEGVGREAHALFRHGKPHRTLPNQINYRGHAWALRELGCEALLITSSVGVMDPAVPLYKPLLLSDLLMPENRLPDGSACSMYPNPTPDHGHLVLNEGLFSVALSQDLRRMGERVDASVVADVLFAYVGGPRSKTRAENRLWASLGAQVNSMTVGPEVVLANELEISCVGLVVGHKYSIPDRPNPPTHESVTETLIHSRSAMERLIVTWLEEAEPVAFANQIYRYDDVF